MTLAPRLFPNSLVAQNPKDTSYVFSGYAPLSVRLVEQVDKPLAVGWQTNEDVSTKPLVIHNIG